MATIADERGYVYWIHLPEHTDIFTEGYVGITTNYGERFRVHKGLYNEKCLHLSRAIKKYGDRLVYDVVLEAAYGYCATVESKLRAVRNIGWNIAVGGVFPLFGSKMSKEGREKQKASVSKKANVYEYKTNILVAEGVVVTEWAKANGCINSCLCRTAYKSEGRKQHKGYYIEYVKEAGDK